jgi:large subunit ribosomal protein L17
MHHQQSGRKLSRNRSQRKALFRTMLGSLVMREKITTTEAKAKELKGKIDKLINKAKKSKLEGRKVSVIRDLNTEIPVMAVKKIVGDFLDKFDKRGGGYARVIKLAPRKSDNAKMAVIELITD